MIKLTFHTARRVLERKVSLAWTEVAVTTPDWTAPDKDPTLTQSFKAIAEYGGRIILKVVHGPTGTRSHEMKTTYDRQADAFYARFAPDGIEIAKTREVAPGVMIDLDAKGDLVGVEVLSVLLRAAGTYGSAARPAAAE
jgi:uncharacterized protein YuzE